jgi:predicted PurR-regulated permease PerM
VSVWAEASLAVIAVATLTMALIQVSVIIYSWMLARRISRLVTQIEQELKPLADSVNAMARDAARATALAAAQVDRVDKLFGDLTSKIEETASTIQRTVVAPLRNGAAVMAGIRTAISVFQNLTRGRSRGGTEDDDALFIG